MVSQGLQLPPVAVLGMIGDMKSFIDLHPDVAAALAENRPVVALESTVITHGLPHPHNLETARAVEATIRAAGATPATIAVLSGRICVGLTDAQLVTLATRPLAAVRKCSRRDFPLVIGRREDGATTVAGTMIVAHQAGIPVFATGGIGGVHRGHPFDVSADLIELGRTPVCVISSGPKSILDLHATREVLETNGVPVLGWGTDEMPAFYTPRSGVAVDARVDSVAEAAAIVAAHLRGGLQNGLLLTVPVPAGQALAADEVERVTTQATAEADAAGIHGFATTPWLLNRVLELTAGRSLTTNIALLRNNARVAAELAIALRAPG